MQLDVIYPEHIAEINEMRAILDAGDKVGEIFEDYCDELEDNLNIATSRESGIARREKILNIAPLDTESLEDRRLKVMLKWYEKAPYTLRVLKNKLDACLGAGNYELRIEYEQQQLTCLIELTRKSMLKSVAELLEDILPLDLIYDVELRYNQYVLLEMFTYGELEQFTHEILRNEVVMKVK